MSASAHIASAQGSQPRSRLLLPILAGGAVAGVLDLTSAFITMGWGVCRGIAGGLVGTGANQGGTGVWILGLFLHFLIATTIAAVYCSASRRLPILREHFFVCGLIYGVVVWLVMNLIVLPLSAYHASAPRDFHAIVQGILIHMLLIGLPVAFVDAKLTSSGARART